MRGVDKVNFVALGKKIRKYRKAAKLSQEKLAEMCECSNGHIGMIENAKTTPSKATAIPLVLHGGSGVPDDQIRSAVAAGIRKMNFSTDLCCAFLDACRLRDKSIVGIDLFMEEPIRAVEKFALEKIDVLGSGGIL